MHQECLHLDQGLAVFQYPLGDPTRHTPVEQFLDQLLQQLYPEQTYFVEFWKRSEWRHILAHTDMDGKHIKKISTQMMVLLLLYLASRVEGWEKQTSQSPSTPLRHPETGHVLYLQVGEFVRGPTVVWNVTRGGDLIAGNVYEMISVPAVPGRLLQFQGTALHAVPRPSDVYWTHQEDGNAPYDTSLDLRSVLLFNTWPVDQGMIVDLNVLNATDTIAPITHYANPKSEWKNVDIVNYEEARNVSWWDWLYRILTSSYYETFWIPLMGNERRRGMESRIAKVEGHYGIRESLRHSDQINRMIIQAPKQRVLGLEL